MVVWNRFRCSVLFLVSVRVCIIIISFGNLDMFVCGLDRSFFFMGIRVISRVLEILEFIELNGRLLKSRIIR